MLLALGAALPATGGGLEAPAAGAESHGDATGELGGAGFPAPGATRAVADTAPATAPAIGPAPGSAGGDCAVATARAVQSRYDAVEDLRIRFRQTRRRASLGGRGGGELESQGVATMAKPGRMRWVYESPEPSLFVTDGSVVWTYDPGLGEAQRLPDAGQFLSGAALQFLVGEGRLEEEFSLAARNCGSERVALTLVPLRDAGYERLVLDVVPERGEVLATEVHDLFGNRTRIEFESVEYDVGPDASEFRFEPPEGVEVIELEPISGRSVGAGRPLS